MLETSILAAKLVNPSTSASVNPTGDQTDDQSKHTRRHQ